MIGRQRLFHFQSPRAPKMIKNLFLFANKLDQKGLYKEADAIDYILLKLAMSLEDARLTLGVSSDATPEDIQKAWKQKAFEAHPDRGGSELLMKRINVARDVLIEARRNSPYRPRPETEYRPKPKPKPEPKRVSWEQAQEWAKIPDNVKWLFITKPSYSPYLGDKSAKGFVVVGEQFKGASAYVCVSVYYFSEKNHFTGTDTELYEMKTQYSSKDPKELERTIKSMFNGFPLLKKGFGGKVIILPKNTAFDKSISHTDGREVSLKNAIEILEEKPISIKGKVDIVLELGRGEDWDDHILTFIVNGRPFKLSKELSDMLTKKSNLLRAVFGFDYYSGRKKNITRMRKNKDKILNFLANKLEGKGPEELVGALKRAAEAK